MKHRTACFAACAGLVLASACSGQIGSGTSGSGDNGPGQPSGAGGAAVDPGEPGQPGGAGPVAGCAAAGAAATALHARLLSPAQYDNTIQDLFHLAGHPAKDFGGGADTQLDDLAAERRANAAAIIAHQAATT